MAFDLKMGMKARVEITVGAEDTAVAFGSGGVKVLATPRMVGIMENAALQAVEDYLPEGYTTVGTDVDIKHFTATPMGMNAYAEAELVKIEGKKLLFKVIAYDEKDKIGEGLHGRFIINLEKFMEKTENKAKS
ncbi:thioesterase family protein [Serpentinicella sp. ANB-PHB4]|uniref:thioesterase family protein n=1 Tax=Serpentinicella sp. ANB-PHB4 TaxID=3074076 RepID=UPI00285B7F7C|nr:thioesterase family protein [Serpentinicella sp. ANB-PHB4]MDR5658584.1 thioesterase family protein [Serpentinicella sp. ANB-PHB4]